MAEKQARRAGRRRALEGAPLHRAPTYLDQIVDQPETVFTGFLIASLVAVPLGILCGTSALSTRR